MFAQIISSAYVQLQSVFTNLPMTPKGMLQEVEIALAEEAFQKDKAQLADLWDQRTQQFQQAVDLQVRC